jgi:cell division protein FtsI (penicillin-binding protein 3)
VAQKDKVELKKKSVDGVPNTVGMGMKDALFLLENKGYTVRVNGRGVVKLQTTLAGNRNVIILNLG